MSSFSPASTQPDTLPTPRVVITNLINSLTSAPLPPPGNTADNNAADAANPLKTLPPPHRPLLVTLHVLFPSLVLPALDLLDRNLVTRVVPEATTPPSAGLGRGHGHRERNNPTNPAPAACQHQPSINPNDAASEAVADGQGSPPPPPPPRLQPATNQPPAAAAAFHLVRSVASTMTRRHHAVATSASASTTYLVHLDAWNCSCANFAYEAFPAVSATSGSSGGGRDVDPDLVILGADEVENDGDDDNSEASDWQFGGLSLDGVDDGGVPCCKHLLACLLSEQWADTLGKYVTERRVNREEMAGLVADV
ncbi:hypothetical protein CSIM01_07632 [Colletotrichum simmondsii]|uniref:SWIM-type domain-containing protein n=1 Tax=Colletotrichum simmondsii TaxID=703756 RepID=A0A135SBC1_9PEZI|nr:hypothetical protein CSIM01_07632 [Colletotrichum simmondsii]